MKTRVISGIAVALILVGAAFGIWTPVWDILFCLLAGAATYEVMKVAGIRYMPLRVVAVIFGALFPAVLIYLPQVWIIALYVFVVLLVYIILTLANNKEVLFKDMTISLYATLLVPAGFACVPIIANLYQMFPGQIDKYETFYMTFSVVVTALLNDVFAYFIGSQLGKHKMTPVLSPHKSWEGAIGGIICDVIAMMLFLLIFVKCIYKKAFFMPAWLYGIIVLITAVVSIYGDLIASFIKRNYGVKDYSHLIPGHGGIMDRFDSVILAAPTMFALTYLFAHFALV